MCCVSSFLLPTFAFESTNAETGNFLNCGNCIEVDDIPWLSGLAFPKLQYSYLRRKSNWELTRSPSNGDVDIERSELNILGSVLER